MEQKSLRVLDANKTFFSKISSTITKMLIPTKVGINSIMISIKRSNLIKAYYNYISYHFLKDRLLFRGYLSFILFLNHLSN